MAYEWLPAVAAEWWHRSVAGDAGKLLEVAGREAEAEAEAAVCSGPGSSRSGSPGLLLRHGVAGRLVWCSWLVFAVPAALMMVVGEGAPGSRSWMEMAPLRTLRATPQGGFPQIKRTCDFMEQIVKFSGRTVGTKRSEGRRDYFDIEFISHEEARYTLNILNGMVPFLDFYWAPHDLTSVGPPSGPVDISFLPPKCDLDTYSELPSLPLPANQPFPTYWRIPRQRREWPGLPAPPRLPARRHPPSRIQMDEVDPRPPFEARYWPEFHPTYNW